MSQLEQTLKLAHQANEIGDIDQADQLYMQALAEAEELAGVDMAAFGDILYEMQQFYAKVGDKEKAKALARRFRQIALHYFHEKEERSS
jgi:hypothetical protein